MPPEVPEEFAAAYRAAYERALAAQTGGAQHRAQPETPAPHITDSGKEFGDTDELPLRRGPLVVGTHRTEEYDDRPTVIERVTRAPWFVPLLLTVLALLLIFGAYAIGRSFADKISQGNGAEPRTGVVTSEGGAGKKRQPVTTQAAGKGAWDARVKPVEGLRAKANCTAPPGQDASGAPVSYGADNLVDGVADTTWRCQGTAIGRKITLRLPGKTSIGEVGLIPGYAKTDEASGADRYAENNRVTRVRWTIGDRQVVQKIDDAPLDRSLRLLRVPKTDAREVGLEILDVKRGPRNTTAISEIQVSRTD